MMMNQRIRHVAIGTDLDPLYISCANRIRADQSQHFGHPGMSERTGWEGLDGDSGHRKRPRSAELVKNSCGIIAATIGVEEAALCLQDLFCATPAKRSEVGRHNTTLRCVPGLKRLHESTEVFSQAGRVAGSNGKGA